jgi:hypothetical protein
LVDSEREAAIIKQINNLEPRHETDTSSHAKEVNEREETAAFRKKGA